MKKIKNKKILAIIAPTIIILALTGYMIRLKTGPDYYTITNDYTTNGITEGARCLALTPECLYGEVELSDKFNKRTTFKYYEPVVVSESGEPRNDSELTEGVKVRYVNNDGNNEYIEKFIILNK